MFIVCIFILVIPVLFFINILFWKRKTLNAVAHFSVHKILLPNYSHPKFILKFFLLFIPLVLLCFVLLSFTNESSGSNAKKQTDVIIAIDVSKSMLCTDIEPTRLAQAQSLAHKIVALKENNRIGIVAFAGKAFLQMPLSYDTAEANMTIEVLQPVDMPVGGTAIGDALQQCFLSFNFFENTAKKIVLLTDGENQDTSITTQVKLLQSKDIVVHTIGIGTINGGEIFDDSTAIPKKDNDGNTVITKLNEPLLKDIASTTNGRYAVFENSTLVLNTVFSNNDDKKQTHTALSIFTVKKYQYWLFLIPVLICLITELFVAEIRKIK